jgi:hypothetical protein
MDPKTEPFRLRHRVWLPAILYAACGLILFPHYQNKLYPDTISYISIARKYLEGDFANAVNSYWAPLLSWGMVPLMRLGFDPLQAIKLVTIVAGVSTIIAADRLFDCFPILPWARRLALLALVPAVLYFSMSMPTPDLLLTASLTAYLAVICRDDYASRWTRGVLCGALGGLAYLSKHYALPFFVVHFCVLNAWHYRRSGRHPAVALNAAAGLVTCAIVALPWIAALSAKHGGLSIGTAGPRTYAYVGPHSRGDTLGPHGLVPPPNPTAVSAWEDPSTDMLEKWSPFESRENLRHQAGLMVHNLKDVATGLQSFSPLALVILGAYAILAVWVGKLRKTGIPLLTMAVYGAGYLCVMIEVRYLWPLCVLLVLMAGVLLSHGRRVVELGPAGWRVAAAVCLGSFLVMPGLHLLRDFDSGRDLRELADLLRQRYGVGGNIAAHNQYRTPLYLAYHLDGRFFGTSDRTLPERLMEDVILQNEIDYYFVWIENGGDDQALPGFLIKYPEITAGAVPGLRVYHIKGGPPGS